MPFTNIQQPPFPRPKVRPNGSFRGLPQKENSLQLTSGGITGTLDPDAADLTGPIGSGTGILQKNGTAIELIVSNPYQTWSGGAPFNADANNDGVKDGLAWLLGAANPNVNATGLLPSPNHGGGALVLTFRMRNAASRGDALLQLQHSSDLGLTDPWSTPVTVPETGGTVGGVTFTVTPNGVMNDVQATIPSTESTGGKLFGRLNGLSAP